MSKLKTPQVSGQTAHEMLRRAEAAKTHTYPKGKIGFAVTVLTDKGNIFEGVSYLSDTYTLTMHCEMVALAHAATHGEHNIVAITGPKQATYLGERAQLRYRRADCYGRRWRD